jgi:Tfp pilus assembly protein PilF
MRHAVFVAVTGALLLAGCQSEPIRDMQTDFKSLFGRSKGEPAMAAGLRQYEEGNYAEAAKQLQSAIDQGLARTDRVNAHKTLAFIHCVSGRTSPCRDEFRKALAIEPEFDLPPAEAGHPIWGPVFRSVKAGR